VYTSVRNAPEIPPGDGDHAVAGQPVEPGADAATRTSRRRRITGQVGGTVIAMGAVSFLTDASAEMVTAVLPLFLILQVGLTPLQYGVVDGVYQGRRLAGRPARHVRGAARLERPGRRLGQPADGRDAAAAGAGRRLAGGGPAVTAA